MSTQTSAKTDYKRLNRQIDPTFIEKLVHDTNRPVMLRAMTMSWLTDIKKPIHHDLLTRAALGSEPAIQIEAVRLLGKSARQEVAATLLRIAHDEGQPTALRAEAIAALAGKPDITLVSLLNDPAPVIRIEAARSLRALAANPEVQRAAREKRASIRGDGHNAKLQSQLDFLVAPAQVKRPATVDDWRKLLSHGGAPDAGRRVFFSANSTCTACHAAEGRGVKLGSGSTAGFIAMPLGPDLSVIGQTADRDALIHSIVAPSDYVAPEYQGWFVKMNNGDLHTGREIDQASKSIQLIMLDGNEHDFPRTEIESWGAMAHSLMPEGVAQTMAIEEFRDLIAYLESLR
jgi:putative heme-binding domain-containing protein